MSERERVLALRGEGLTQEAIAAQLGISRSAVRRVLAAESDSAPRPAMDAVEEFVLSLGVLSPEVAARVAALRSLAAKLDWAQSAQTGAAAMAAASLTKEYRNLLDELRQSASWDELREALLAGDSD